jgi:hypothetical protein
MGKDMSLDKRYFLLNFLLVVTLISSSCRTIKSVTLPKSQTFSENPFCDQHAQKILICTVRDVVSRAGTKKSEVIRSPLASLPKVTMSIYPNNVDKDPSIEFVDAAMSQEPVRFEKTSDLYHRNGCLVGIEGGIFSEGFTPRASIKVILSAKNTDHAVFAEISDFRYNYPIHFTLDLQCERKTEL